MKLLRLHVDGFGVLRGDFVFERDKLVLLIDENERGKSTLVAAIGAALYGLDGDRRTHRMLTPLDRWRPWEGGAYRVELELEHESERYTIRRDFERGTVEVWNGRGQELTPEFREGKEEFPVGRKLLGLDADEFEKCALVRQGELDRVVPADEKARRASTLHARLENAADTRVGDTNASEALRVLEGALRRYTSPEVEFTGTADVAIQRLEAKRGLLEAELKTLEHDLSQVQGPLEELAALAEEEKQARQLLEALELDRHAALAGEVRRQLDEHARHREERQQLQTEADALASAAHMPANSEAQLHETVARYEEAQRNLGALETRRRDEIRRERESLQKEVGALTAYESCSAADADQCVSLVAEIRRVAQEDSRLRDEVFNLRETLASRGHDPERFQWLHQRFGGMSEEEQRLLRRQSELALAYQTEVAGLEQERTENSETLREVDAIRNRRRMPGWLLGALGLAGLVGGGTVAALKGVPALWTPMIVAGGVLMVVGSVLILAGGRARERERADALQRLSEAQRRLNQLRTQRAETELGLSELARRMGYRDQVELLREWNEFVRLLDESGPALRAQEQLATLESRRRQAVEQARAVLERVGGGTPDPATLESVAAGIRKLVGVRQRMAELEKSWSWIDEEKRVAEAAASGLKERALRILQSAGLGYDPQRTWADHARDLADRMKGKTRYLTLMEELIPRAEARMLSDQAVAELESQLALIQAARPGGEPPVPSQRTPVEIEAESRRCRETLDRVQKRRGDLRVQVEEVWRRYHVEHPEKLTQKQRIEQALGRARRFKHAVELARETLQSVATETHRRWAEYLNQRVAQLLESLGTRVEQMRFGDDLDFSVKLWNGQQLARGKADLQLSSGARDQLYLAVRLAVSEFLSRGQSPLPLLLDDVFATSDDQRARAGMQMLIEHFGREHQILLFTCHRRRYEALAQLDPEIYAAHVQWLDTRAAIAAR